MWKSSRRSRPVVSSILAGVTALLAAEHAAAQCPVSPLVTGLRFPLGVTRTSLGNLAVAESGLGGVREGRISIVDTAGNRRTLLDGLPSGTNDVGEPSGPAGLVMRGRTLFVVIGIGDAGLPGPFPGALIVNPNPSSPFFGGVLAIRFSAAVERTTEGVELSPRDLRALADVGRVRVSNAAGDLVTIELVADFPDLTPWPDLPGVFRGVNPFDVAVMGDRLFVTDGGQNVVWEVDVSSGAFAELASFPQLANPIPGEGLPPMTDAVPTGIREWNGELLVALLSGFPFAEGTASIEQVDPASGAHQPLLEDVTTAIDVLPLAHRNRDDSYLVLQHSSGSFFGGPGHLVHLGGAGPRLVADCLGRPTSIVRDARTGTLYITEIIGGRLVQIRQPRWRSADGESEP